MIPALNALHDEMRIFSSDVHHISASQARELVPVLRIGPQHIVAAVIDETGRKLDADALLQGNIRRLRRNGGQIEIDARLTSIAFEDGHWRVQAGDRAWRAPILVNAAGAWADEIAALAGVAPLGLRPLRRTIIVFDPPPGVDASGWPFVKTAVDEFYMLPEAGKLLASPVDEAQSAPVDAQPEDFDIALAAYRVEQFTTMSVARVSHRWAGLRSFVADRIPTAGFAPDAKGFFWLAGQGGYGLQTAPAMAAATASIILGSQWPSGLADLGVSPDHIAPARLRMG
jgi:D-arginine dehydrogenase